MQKKLDLKSATCVVTSKFGQKTDLDSLKSDFDRSEIDKLETSPVDLSELSNVVKNEVVKKDVNDKLVKKANYIQTTNTSDLVQIAHSNAKIDEI